LIPPDNVDESRLPYSDSPTDTTAVWNHVSLSCPLYRVTSDGQRAAQGVSGDSTAHFVRGSEGRLPISFTKWMISSTSPAVVRQLTKQNRKATRPRRRVEEMKARPVARSSSMIDRLRRLRSSSLKPPK